MREKRRFKVGNKVMYSGEFLRNIGVYTGDMCFVIGTVVHVEDTRDYQLVEVVWTDYSPTWAKSFTREWLGDHAKILACNLVASPWN